MKKKLINKYKLTPEAMKMIEGFLKTLPQFQRKNEKGELMFTGVTKFHGTSEWKGTGKDVTYKNKIARGKEPLMVNHKVNLCEVFQKDGHRGVAVYVEAFMKLAKESLEGKKENV